MEQAVRRCRALTQDIQIRHAAVDAVLRTGERLQDATPTQGAKPALPPKPKTGPTPPPKPSQLSPTRATKPSPSRTAALPQSPAQPQQPTPQTQTVEFAALHQASVARTKGELQAAWRELVSDAASVQTLLECDSLAHSIAADLSAGDTRLTELSESLTALERSAARELTLPAVERALRRLRTGPLKVL